MGAPYFQVIETKRIAPLAYFDVAAKAHLHRTVA